MTRYLPSVRGWLALGLAVALGVFLPTLLPARSGHTGQLARPLTNTDWLLAFTSIVICIAACIVAARRRAVADRLSAGAAGLFVTWMIYAFVRHAA